MAEEKKIDRADDPINLLLEQALTRQRDEMMENFAHILKRLPIASCASSSSGHFEGTPPFKVQVNFDIPVFEVIRGSNFAQFSKCSECDENSAIASVSSS
jgi:hypothetical protein